MSISLFKMKWFTNIIWIAFHLLIPRNVDIIRLVVKSGHYYTILLNWEAYCTMRFMWIIIMLFAETSTIFFFVFWIDLKKITWVAFIFGILWWAYNSRWFERTTTMICQTFTSREYLIITFKRICFLWVQVDWFLALITVLFHNSFTSF